MPHPVYTMFTFLKFLVFFFYSFSKAEELPSGITQL